MAGRGGTAAGVVVTAPSIDLNADVGEDPAAQGDGREEMLLSSVTSANVACGGHAGDEATMREAVRLAAAHGVVVGAHPGYPDPARFGRVELDLSPEALEAVVGAQVARLAAVAREAGVPLRHVKPHGALYHAVARRREVALAFARAALAGDAGRLLVGPAGSAALDLWRDLGATVAAEAFADRRYEADGSLRSRSLPGALLTDPAEAAAQAVAVARGQGAVAADGARVALRADTLCVHGDTPGASALARAVRAALEAAGFRVRAPSGGRRSGRAR